MGPQRAMAARAGWRGRHVKTMGGPLSTLMATALATFLANAPVDALEGTMRNFSTLRLGRIRGTI